MAVNYSQAEKDRELIIKKRQRKTAKAFERMRAKIDEQIATMNMSTVSERVKRQQLEEIRNELQKALGTFYGDLESGLKSDMISIGESVLSDSAAFYNSLNMPLSIGITSFPVEIMESVINGSVYNEKWFLSGALWGDYQSKLDDINQVITEGIGLNKPIYDIAKDLEKYVDPNARKDWSWSKVYPGTAKTVDYNAQRLARTLISHAYQQNVVKQAQANPFATGVKWIASGSERMCEICEDRDGKIFPIDDVPMDHPNGMCTFSVETPSMMEMSNTLADWVNGEPTDWDDQLDAYYEGMPIDHKSTANVSEKEETNKRDFNPDNLPKEIIGIIGEPGDPIDPDELLKVINPGWESLDRYYRQNCQRCASSFELGRRGYSLEAKPFNGSYPDWRLFMNGKDFIDGKGYRTRVDGGNWKNISDTKYLFNRSPKTTANSLIKAMKDWGAGSRATLSVTWRNSNTSHIVNVENINGVVTIFDAQPGIKYTNIEDYLSKTKCAETELARTDNAYFKDFNSMNEASYKNMLARMETMFRKR